MANENTPRGFKPVRQQGSNAAWNGALTPYRIASGYATAIYTGDVVKLVTAGVIQKASAGDQMRGVFMGAKWVGTDGVPRFSPYWPASTAVLASGYAEALVVDDPNVIFEAVFTNSTSVPAVADIGATFDLYDAGGSAATGLSGEGIDFTTLATTAKQFRFMDFVQRPDNDQAAAYSRGLFAPDLHDFRVNTGI